MVLTRNDCFLAELRRSREGLQSTHPGRMRFP